MKLSLKQTMITLVLIAALFAALAGGFIHFEAAYSAPIQPHHAPLAWECVAPPVVCM